MSSETILFTKKMILFQHNNAIIVLYYITSNDNEIISYDVMQDVSNDQF